MELEIPVPYQESLILGKNCEKGQSGNALKKPNKKPFDAAEATELASHSIIAGNSEVISYVVAQDILGTILGPNMMVEQHIRICIKVRITKHSFFKSHGLSTKVFLACEEDS